MSLIRQLWLAVISMMLIIFIGSFLVSVLTARAYLEQQLSIKNLDNAGALALTLSQLPEKDPVAIELLVSAQFDTGHYQEIRLTDPQHQLIIERTYTGETLGAPAWFARIFPIRTSPGIAQVQDGWRQLGTLTLSSHSRYAYQELWGGALKLLGWLVAAGLLAGVVGTFLLRIIVNPLNQVVEQAQAISERRFTTLTEPSTPELKSVVRAMNQMVSRLKQMFSDEAAQLDHLQRKINHDAVTGLANREAFMSQLHAALTSDDAAPWGALLFVRMAELGKINRTVGHDKVDILLQQVATQFNLHCAEHPGHFAARLKGADFALLAPDQIAISELGQALASRLSQSLASASTEVNDHFHLGVVRYHRGDDSAAILASADQALAAAESKGPDSWHALDEQDVPLALSADAWRNLLCNAVAERRIKLALFPVHTSTGQTLHQESVVRMQTELDGQWLVAGDFIPMAARLRISSSVDLEVIRLALEALQSTADDIAINLAAETIADWGFHNLLSDLLIQHPQLSARLWLEVSEYGALSELEAFRDMARILKMHHCRIGIEHAGHRLSELGQLADIGLDYLKVDSSLVQAIDQHSTNQTLLKGICKMAHTLDITVIAEGVQSQTELALLLELGFDAVTGPDVS